MPGTKKRLGIKVPGENKFLYIGSVIFGATLVSIFALGQYQASLQAQSKDIQGQLLALEQRRDKSGEEDLKTFKNQIALTSDLLDKHVYWTQGLAVIVNLLQSDVRFKSFSGNISSSRIAINVQASNYTALARQAASFLTEESISDFAVGKITSTTAGYLEATLDIKFDKVKLLQKAK